MFAKEKSYIKHLIVSMYFCCGITICLCVLPDMLLTCCSAETAVDTSKWEISLRTVLPKDKPANSYVEKLIEELNKKDWTGEAVTLREFRQICNRTSPVVYVDKVIKYATPRSVKIQKEEHADYTKVFMKEKRQKEGVRFLRNYNSLLRKAQSRYGVHRKDIVSILMWESGLGEFTGENRIFNIFMGQILYMDDARKVAVDQIKREGNPDKLPLELTKKERQRLEKIRNRAVKNLASLLRNSKEKGVDPLQQLGSWGGAIGYVQFMPSSIKFAVDGDNDGEINLSSWPDAIFSVGNFLKEHGYGMDYTSRKKGIFGYNPIDSYVKGVITYADAIWSRYQRGE